MGRYSVCAKIDKDVRKKKKTKRYVPWADTLERQRRERGEREARERRERGEREEREKRERGEREEREKRGSRGRREREGGGGGREIE
jgi:hypothetical protein